MPLTEEQKQAIETLKGVTADDAEEFRSELQAKNNAVVHHIFRRGFAEAEGRYKPRAETAEAKVTEAEEKAAEAERKLKEAEGKQPDVEKITADWQTKYDRDVAAAKKEAEDERTARKSEREARRLADLRAELAPLVAADDDPAYVEYLASKHAARIRTKDDGTVELLEAGTEIPMQVPSDKSPAQVLAVQIVDTLPASRKRSGVDTGGGADAGGGGDKGNKFQQMRERLQKEREGQKVEGPSIEERLGMKSGAA